MTTQKTLSVLNKITSKYSKNLYNETSFHDHFKKDNNNSLGISFEDVDYALNKLIYEIQVDEDKFIYNDYDNLETPVDIYNGAIYATYAPSTRGDFKKSLNSMLDHLDILIKMPAIRESKQYYNYLSRLDSMKTFSQQVMDEFEPNTLFKTKVQIINQKLKINNQHKKEKDFLIRKLKKLANEYPVINETKIRELFYKFNENYINIEKECKEIIKSKNPIEFECMADRFIESMNLGETPVQQFLINKQKNIEIICEEKFTKSQINQEVYIFSDHSIVVNHRDDGYKKIEGSIALRQFNFDLHLDSIDYMLRKKPQVNKFFKAKFLEENNYSAAINAIVSFNENEVILKNSGIKLALFQDKSFEAIDDYINHIKKIHKVEQFAGSILSAKYKHLLNINTFPLFETLYEKDFGQKELQMYIGKKLAAIKSDNDMINILKGTLNLFSGFLIDNVIEKLENLKIKPIINENNILVFEVENYANCKEMGSPAWCIVRNESYFEQYTKDDSRQYICYDFNKSETDINSLVGFTYDAFGTIDAAHYKNDDAIDYEEDTKVFNIFQQTLYLNKSRHQIDNELLQKLDNEYIKIKNNKHGVKLS